MDGPDKYRRNAQKLITVLVTSWQEKHQSILDLDFLKDIVGEVLADKVREEVAKSISFISIRQLVAMCEELVDLTEAEQIEKSNKTKMPKEWKKDKKGKIH